jgi:hypothetical protein
VVSRVVNTVKIWKCPLCGGDCLAIGEEPAGEPPRPFFSALAGAFVYPFRGSALWMLLVGPVILAGARFTSWMPLFGWIIYVAVWSYVMAFMVKVIRCSAGGEADPPGWPELGGEELLRPLLLLLVTWLVYLLPAFLAHWLCADSNPGLVAALYLAGAFFLPMAATMVALANSLLALNPVLVIRSILRVPLEYLVVLFFLAVAAVLEFLMRRTLDFDPLEQPLHFLAAVPAGIALTLYFLLVQMRILGVMYRANEHKLGWF